MLKRIEMPLKVTGQGLRQTSEGQNIGLDQEVAKDALVLYRETEDEYVFAGLYTPEIEDKDYEDGIVAMPLESTFIQVVEFNDLALGFWNVVGSTGDTFVDPQEPEKEKNRWVRVWEAYTGQDATQCYVLGGCTVCNGSLVGGHMQLFDPKVVPEPKTVYIIPICRRHNSKKVTGMVTLNLAHGKVKALEMAYKKPK